MITCADGENVVWRISLASVLYVVDVGAEFGDPKRHTDRSGSRSPQEIAKIVVVMGKEPFLGSAGNIESSLAYRVFSSPGEIKPMGVVALSLQEYYSANKAIFLS